MPDNGIVLDYVVPIIGTILTNFLFISPLPTVLRIDSTQILGELNPLPYPLMIFNCAGWIIYGLSFGSPTVYYMFMANLSGLIGGIYYALVTYPLASRLVQVRMRFLFIVLPFFEISAAYFLAFALRGNQDSMKTALGWVAISISVIFFASPLSTIFQVLRTKSGASIHIPLAITAGISTFLWTVYGIALADWFLIVPNGLATIFSTIQLVLVFIFRKASSPEPERQNEEIAIEGVSQSLSKKNESDEVEEIHEVA